MDAYNVLIIGSGPAGLFAAMQLERLGLDRIAIIDRHPYPAGGLLNDGKLNFDYRVGIDLDELNIDRDSAQCLMEEIRQVFIHFPKCQQVTFVDKNEKIEALANIAKEHDAQFIAPEQWHWGTDNGKSVVDYLRNHLKKTEFFAGNGGDLHCKIMMTIHIMSSAVISEKKFAMPQKSFLPLRGAVGLTGFVTSQHNYTFVTISVPSMWESALN